MTSKIALAAATLFCAVASQSMAVMSISYRSFARRASGGGMAEVAPGQLAQQNGASGQVKAFEQRIVQDHCPSNDDSGTLLSVRL
jgi:putative membrane protein